MFGRVHRFRRALLCNATAAVTLVAYNCAANAQAGHDVTLPQVTVIGTKKPKPAAVARRVAGFDGQLSYFTRYNNLHFTPDPSAICS
jgi:hypothetical protein